MKTEVVIDPAALRYAYDLRLAGCGCRIQTNSHTLGHTLVRWQVAKAQLDSSWLQGQILVNTTDAADYEPPHFRGMKHVVIAAFGSSNVFLFDLLRRSVAAVVSQRVAADQRFWDRVLLPIVVGVLGPTVGVVPVHAACMTFDGGGLLIAGASGAGKSTLSVALAQQGFDFVSDDWSYLGLRGNSLVANGMSVPAKLLPDAVSHFPVLERYSATLALNQELAYELPVEELGLPVRSGCRPRWFFFLKRKAGTGFQLLPVCSDEALQYIERSVERLPPELQSVSEIRARVIEQAQRLSCWKLTYDGPPQVAVDGLQEFFAAEKQGVLV